MRADDAPRGTWPLELDRNQREALIFAASALLESVRRAGPESPIHLETPAALVQALLAPPPESGGDPGQVMQRLADAAATGWSKLHGGDLGYIPSGGLYAGAVAAFLAAGVHAFTAAAFESPALVALEEGVLRWMASLLGLPLTAQGLLVSGGSMANQAAIVCAREAAGAGFGAGRVWLPPQAHHSLRKALHLCGVPAQAVADMPADAHGAPDPAALRLRIAADTAAGRRTWLIVGVAGSTDTGSIDPLPALADIAAECGAWFHADAAYGGFFMLTDRGHERLHGIERADSVTLDAHKGLQLPYGLGAVLVRHPGSLARAHAAPAHADEPAAYMRDVPPEDDLPHYFDRGPELTRPFRGLLAWLPLQLHGVARFREALDRSLDLAQAAAERLGAIAGIDMWGPPSLSIVAFRCKAGDARTQALQEAINTSGRFRVSGTVVDAKAAIRLAFLNHRTGRAELDALMRLIERNA
jgi:aromatic-L-amino-acid/L-tryptophan decarboxylase